MSANPRIGSAFRLIGFVFLVIAMVPVFRGEDVNAALLAPGLAFWIVGLVIGLKAKRNPPTV
jgi:hypothetical protein